MSLVARAPRFLFVTGKGGVGKTSVACATAVALADSGRRVLVVSTDPASNLDEVLATSLEGTPRPVSGVPRLSALNIDPEEVSRAYRERVVGPYRGVLPDAAVRSIEEQLSGACTTEIAAFDEFSKLLGSPVVTADFDHVVFDTAPTGHTLRLLELPAAWSEFLAWGGGATSCVGPLSILKAQQSLYAACREALVDADRTALVLVSRADRAALAEAERARAELAALGVRRMEFVLNGSFEGSDGSDPLASAFEAEQCGALAQIPVGLTVLPRTELPLLADELLGVDALRAMLDPARRAAAIRIPRDPEATVSKHGLDSLIPLLEERGRGVILVMGKGGVGKTSIATAVASALARRGHAVSLTTTDPAGRPDEARANAFPNLRVSRIDPAAETRAYSAEVLRVAGASLDPAGRALLEEDLRSPCTEEVAVFRAFARAVADAERGFVVIDTAPTGHSLLLLDAAEAYHREVLRSSGDVPEEVRRLLPRLRDPDFTRILLVTVPEATPVHEAAALQRDLGRADIRPFAWIVNQSLSPLVLSDPLLASRKAREKKYLREVEAMTPRMAVLPWLPFSRDGGLRLDMTAALAAGTSP